MLFLNRGFWKGLVTGGIIGAMANMFMKPERRPFMDTRMTKMRDTARELEEDLEDMVEDGISGLWKK